MRTFSPSIRRSWWVHRLLTWIVLYFVLLRPAFGDSVVSAIISVIVLGPGVVFLLVVRASSVEVDEQHQLVVRQRGKSYELGPLAEATLVPTWLPFGLGIPRLVGERRTVRALALAHLPTLYSDCRLSFAALLADHRL